MIHLKISKEDYDLTKVLVSNMIHFYEKDLKEYEELYEAQNFTTIKEVAKEKEIVLTKEILEEEIEFLTGEIKRTKQLLNRL